MSKNPDIELAPEYAEDWLPQNMETEESRFQSAPLPAGLKTYAYVSSQGTQELTVTSPDGTTVRITADDISGGLRITQVVQEEARRGMLSAVPMGLGSLVLDDRP